MGNGEYWKLYNNEMSQKAMKATATLKEMAKKQAEKYFKQYGHNWRVAEAKAKAQERDTKENHKKTDAAFFREMETKIRLDHWQLHAKETHVHGSSCKKD